MDKVKKYNNLIEAYIFCVKENFNHAVCDVGWPSE